jgi:hypothetical protein
MIITDSLIALTIFTAVLAITIILVATASKSNSSQQTSSTNTIGGINPQNLRFIS